MHGSLRLNHVAAMLALVVCAAAVAQQSAPEAPTSTSGPVKSNPLIVPMHRFGSIASLAEVYREGGLQVTHRPEKDLTVFRISEGEASTQFPARLDFACAQMAKAAGVVLKMGSLEAKGVMIRTERRGEIFGLQVYDSQGTYGFNRGSVSARLPIPRNADLIQLQPLLDSAFGEVSDVVPSNAVRWEPTSGAQRRLPAMECVVMEDNPLDQPVGFGVVPIFVADVRCEPMKFGSATACYYLVVGQSRMRQVVNEAIGRFRATEEAKRDRQLAEQARQDRQAAELLESAEQQRVRTAMVQVASFRKSLREGAETNCGPVIQVKPPHVKVYVPVRDYGNEHWIRLDAIYPPGYRCEFVNGQYRPPRQLPL